LNVDIYSEIERIEKFVKEKKGDFDDVVVLGI